MAFHCVVSNTSTVFLTFGSKVSKVLPSESHTLFNNVYSYTFPSFAMADTYLPSWMVATNNFSASYDDAAGISKIQEYASLLGLDETTGVEIEENDPQIADEYPVMAAIGQSNNNYATIIKEIVTGIS